MTTAEFRQDRARCAAIQRVLDMNVFKQMIEAILTDLELTEAHLMNVNLGNPTGNVEMRLQNQRKGFSDCLNSIKMCATFDGPAAEMPPEEYGAGEDAARLMSQNEPWQPVT